MSMRIEHIIFGYSRTNFAHGLSDHVALLNGQIYVLHVGLHLQNEIGGAQEAGTTDGCKLSRWGRPARKTTRKSFGEEFAFLVALNRRLDQQRRLLRAAPQPGYAAAASD